MGTDIALVAPEEEWSEERLEEYYSYLQNKKQNINPEENWPGAKDTPGYKFGVEYLDETLLIVEQIQRDVFTAIDSNAMYSLFDPNNRSGVLYGKEIEDLIQIFKEAKENLVQKGVSGKKAELRIEAGPVALCEFALDHDFGVELSQ